MKIKIPQPSPYREVDPEDVLVTRVDNWLWSMEAYGILLSERTVSDWSDQIVGIERMDVVRATTIVDGPEYRIAYQDSLGRWCEEGVIVYTPPHPSIMEQLDKLIRMRQDALSTNKEVAG